MNLDPTAPTCSNEACQFAQTGQCVEGNPTSECPYLDVPADLPITPPVDVADRESEDSTSFFAIDAADPLSVPDASAVLKTSQVSLVTLIGSAEAGKTSLIAEVYDAFQYGQYASLFFAGSRTLTAFEKICLKVRRASKAGDLKQERTDLTIDPTFYHLNISDGGSIRKQLLIADRSGETYREVRDTPSIVQDCLELTHGHTLNLLVDGARLADNAERATVGSECYQVVQALAEARLCQSGTQFNVILTKLDRVERSGEFPRVVGDFDRIVERIAIISGRRRADVSTFKIAARPDNESYVKGYGVEPLVSHWLIAQRPMVPYVPTGFLSLRAMDRIPLATS